MNKSFCISIIIPVYNAENNLTKCLDSIMLQSYTNFEVILIDDGSTDSSGQICDLYVHRDSRFHVYHQNNSGVSAARNRGLSLASGDFVAFIDADDWVSSTYLSDLVRYLNPEVELLFFGGDCVTDTSVFLYSFKSIDILKKSQKDFLIEYIARSNILGHIWLMWINLAILREHHIHFDENVSLHEDLIFMCDCILAASGQFVMSSVKPYRYVQYQNNKQDNLSSRIPINYEYIAKECLCRLKHLNDFFYLHKDFMIMYQEMQQRFYMGCIDVICRNNLVGILEKKRKIKELNESLNLTFPIHISTKPVSLKYRIFQFVLNTKNALLICIFKSTLVCIRKYFK